MPDILLVTLNARYTHASFALRYLLANLGHLEEQAGLLEGTIKDRPVDVVESILDRESRIVGLSVHIWNALPSLEVVRLLKKVAPATTIVLGGPEVSYETEDQEICRLADYVVTGEGDLAFRQLCDNLLAGTPPPQGVIPGGRPDPATLEMPYRLYDSEDIAHRTLYVEASRGCPFQCEFCLSSLEPSVRSFPLEPFLREMQVLLDRGARHFKFIDRTFNLKLETSLRILEFFRERHRPGLFLHFEMIPDRFPEAIRPVLKEFPRGALQFEVGVQTFAPEVAGRIKRRQNYDRLTENLEFLVTQTGVHLHADLIAGLPGEDLESFGAGFDRLVGLGPHEIQVGLLKRLRGTPISRHDQEWGMVYSPSPPFEVLLTKNLSFQDLQRLRRFSRYWDLVGNRGYFRETLPRLLTTEKSAFGAFLGFSDWLYRETEATHGIALARLVELLFRYLVDVSQREPGEVAACLARDYTRDKKRSLPEILLRHLEISPGPGRQQSCPGLPARQARHL